MSDPAIFSGRPRVAVPCGCELGEAPAWDDRTDTLHWVDIKRHQLLSWRPDGEAAPDVRQLDQAVTFVELTPDPDVLILGTKEGVARYDLGPGDLAIVLRPEEHIPGNRLNDATVALDGSLWFGTMDDAEREPTGCFYHWSPRRLFQFGDPAVVTNGPTVDAERGVVYAADTTNRRIYRYRLGSDGEPGDRELFVAFNEGWGHPDGVTLDAEGFVWACHWGGSRITRFSPEGDAVLVIPMPTAKVTKVAFGGPDLATLFITTAAIGQDRSIDVQAGHLFAVETGAKGVPSRFCTMGLA